MKIERGIPIPKRFRDSKWVTFWKEMEEGDSIFISAEEVTPKTVHPHRSCFYKDPGFKPVYRKQPCGGFRVWKVAKDSK